MVVFCLYGDLFGCVRVDRCGDCGFCFSVNAAVEASCEFEGSEEVGVSGDSGWCRDTIHSLEGNFDGHILRPHLIVEEKRIHSLLHELIVFHA